MNRSTLEWYEQLARGLLWAAAIVLLLSLIGAIVIAGSDNALPGFEDVQRQGRGVAALASLGGGVTAAGVLAGVGAILRVLVTDRLAKLGPAAAANESGEHRQPELFDAVGDDGGEGGRRDEGTADSSDDDDEILSDRGRSGGSRSRTRSRE